MATFAAYAALTPAAQVMANAIAAGNRPALQESKLVLNAFRCFVSERASDGENDSEDESIINSCDDESDSANSDSEIDEAFIHYGLPSIPTTAYQMAKSDQAILLTDLPGEVLSMICRLAIGEWWRFHQIAACSTDMFIGAIFLEYRKEIITGGH